jgi:hypothetical protein
MFAGIGWLRQYFLGERFRLRSRLPEQECQRRIKEASRNVALFVPDVTGAPAVT